MPERASVFEAVNIGIETTPGTPVAATKKLLSLGIMPRIRSENKRHRPRGSKFPTVAVQNKEWTEARVEGTGVYTEIVYPYSGLFGAADITTPGGGTLTRNWRWKPLSFSPWAKKTYTVETGSWVRAQEFSFGHFTEWGMEFSRDDVTASGAMIGQKTTDGITLTPGTAEVQTLSATGTVSGGTYTITFMGETTTALAWNAVNATILTELNALANIDSGDVVLGGGALPGTPVTITFGGQYASTDVPLMTVNSASLTGGGTYGIVQTTAGAPLTEVALEPISADEVTVYLDATFAGIGVTALTRPLRASWRVSGAYNPHWVLNAANASWAASVDLAPPTEIRLLMQADAAGMALRSDLQDGDTSYLRIASVGDIIEGALNYRLWNDFAVKIVDVSDYQDVDGVYAIEWTMEAFHDTTMGGSQEHNLRTTLTAL